MYGVTIQRIAAGKESPRASVMTVSVDNPRLPMVEAPALPGHLAIAENRKRWSGLVMLFDR